MRFGKDKNDTHEPMQLKRYLSKYLGNRKQRHTGENRMKHRDNN
jgi:hypothetical protein